MLYAFGSNGSGQLGLGHEEDVSTPAPCKQSDGRPFRGTVRSIAAGGNHTLVLLADSTLQCAGQASSGQICTSQEGEGATEDGPPSGWNLFRPFTEETSLGSNQSFSFCAATWEASVVADAQSNALITVGKGSKGELGLGHGVAQVFRPCRLMADLGWTPEELVDIASCMEHTVVVLRNGEVWGWGNGRKGQLGAPNGFCWQPRRIDGIPFRVLRAVCGKEFTYVVGDKADGQHMVLGADKWGVRSASPPAVPGWEDIGASWGSIYVLYESGRLHGWGRNDHGQLPPAGLPDIAMFAAGSEHVVAKTKCGKVLSWGWGEHGNCGSPTDGNGDVTGRWNEAVVPGEVKMVGAGCATSWIYVED